MKACSRVHDFLLPMWPGRFRDTKNDSGDNRTLSCMQGLGSLWTITDSGVSVRCIIHWPVPVLYGSSDHDAS